MLGRAAGRYLARDPVKAGLVDDSLDWPWSSARTHAGLELDRLRTPSGERADARTRTGDPFITSEVLYQLSYVGGAPTLAA